MKKEEKQKEEKKTKKTMEEKLLGIFSKVDYSLRCKKCMEGKRKYFCKVCPPPSLWNML